VQPVKHFALTQDVRSNFLLLFVKVILEFLEPIHHHLVVLVVVSGVQLNYLIRILLHPSVGILHDLRVLIVGALRQVSPRFLTVGQE